MRTLLFLAPQPNAGKTAVSAGLSLHLAYQGRRVLALRIGDPADPAAAADAHTLATLPFAHGRGGRPLSLDEAAALAADPARPVEILFLEVDPGPLAEQATEQFDARVVLVGRGEAALDALAATAQALGPRPLAVVLTAVPHRRVSAARAAAAAAGLPVLAVLPEDRVLYAPSVGEIIDSLDAEVILGDPDPSQTIEHILINPVTTDPGQPYYARLRNKAVITRSDKTDLQLAALQTQTDMLILTGGLPPSPYTIDRAAGEEVPLLLTRADTRQAVFLLEDVYARSRFTGATKLARMSELLKACIDQEALTQLLEQ